MAMLFSPSVANTFIFRGILGAVAGITTYNGSMPIQPTVNLSVTVYSGIQPSAAAITSSWGTYNTTYLFHQPGVNYIQPNVGSAPGGGAIVKTNVPTPVTALNNGTASWAIVWCSNVLDGTSSGQIGNAIIPNINFIVGPVTIGSGDGMVTLSNLSITSGSTVTILDSSIKFQIL